MLYQRLTIYKLLLTRFPQDKKILWEPNEIRVEVCKFQKIPDFCAWVGPSSVINLTKLDSSELGKQNKLTFKLQVEMNLLTLARLS